MATKAHKELLQAAFLDIAFHIQSSQVRYPEGIRPFSIIFDCEWLKPPNVPVARFRNMPADSVLLMTSCNHQTVTLGAKAAALAITQCALGWLSNSPDQTIGKEAADMCHKLTKYIWSRKSGLTETEKILIHRYND